MPWRKVVVRERCRVSGCRLPNEDSLRISEMPIQAMYSAPASSSALDAPGISLISTLMPSAVIRSEEHTSELQSLMRISYAVFCLKKKIKQTQSRDTRCTYKY